MGADGASLRVRDLTVAAPRGRVLLSVPALEIAPGESLGIRGPSGAGKSTLLFALGGLADRMSGQVAWDGTDLCALSSVERSGFRARNVGIVFQDFLLFDELGALANAALPALIRPRADRPAIRARAEGLLSRLGIEDRSRRVPTLSGGERQRVAVARALATSPRILLADEPTANLDRETGRRLIDDLADQAGRSGATLVAVSHDEALLQRMDRVLTMRDGRLERGDG